MPNKFKYFLLNLINLFLIQINLIKCQNQTDQLNNQTNSSTNSPNILPLQLKIGLLFANSTQALRLLFGFAQSAPAINLAIKRARNESLIDNINFT